METISDIFTYLKTQLREKLVQNDLWDETVEVDIGTLTAEESIGNPTVRRDFPLLTGKEAMVEANFKGSRGQAFTLARSTYRGSVQDVLALDMEDDYNKAIFISTLNAVLRHLGCIERTVHCKNDEPERCANTLADTVEALAPGQNVVLVGYQPAILEALTHRNVALRVLDLNPDNVGHERYGVRVEHGFTAFSDAMHWADIVLVTGSTLANGSIVSFLALREEGKPVYFYGNTIAGAAYLCDWPRLCFEAS